MTFFTMAVIANFIFYMRFHSSICLILSLLYPDAKNLKSNDEEKRSLSQRNYFIVDREKISHIAKKAVLEITTAIVI
jgi:hypothetical protein